ncbi:terminase small subunit [Bacillus cereus group sp. Bc222]|uniref:terminase small subunit n=1 Tax=Bacillus TaxID=1386 RepID=UPI000F4ECCCC|nr:MULTISPECIES: terminase small subunit [unclassified Bacillus cereus group]AYY25312.1 terminase [Bacillus sp. FDAARGOS_527]MDA2013107.1 terminase small subunit [Bacillus cereus group sp. Bcc09]MDA2242034.1 terminase small subunit [Bacillus cereus group sp. Bc222]
MSRRSIERDKAFEMYKDSKGEKPIEEIAEDLGKSISLIRKWKSKDKWDENITGNITTGKKVITKVENPKTKKKLKEILDDEELSEKERLFCLYYVKYFNGTQAALKAGYSKDGAHVQASRLLRRERVSSYIKELKGELVENVFVEAMDVLKEYIKIAFADITNYLNFGQREITIQDDDGNEVTRLVNFVDLYEADMVDGSIITEVKQGRDGISVKLADKMKALDKLSQYFDLVPDNFKKQIEEERHKMQMEVQKVHIEKMRAEIKELTDDHGNGGKVIIVNDKEAMRKAMENDQDS